MMRVLPIHFGVPLGSKRGGGKKKHTGSEQFFEVQASQTELQARYYTMPGLEQLFWRGIRLQRRLGVEETFMYLIIFFLGTLIPVEGNKNKWLDFHGTPD